MKLSVYSEIGQLRQVLVHAPGREVDVMPPSMMAELLFDDIIYGPRARLEHQRFCAVLERLGATVLDVEDLLVRAFEAAPESSAQLVDEVAGEEGLEPDLRAELKAMAPRALAEALVHGLLAAPDEMEPDYLFRLAPLPNLLFTRDPQIVLGDGVVIGSMSRRARQREPLLSRFVFAHHPDLCDAPMLLDFLRRPLGRRWPQNTAPTIEGGDVLVFHEGVIAVGVSERTMERAVDLLAELLRRTGRFHTLLMVPLPRARTSMHLDTIFTRMSAEECLVYSPMVLPGRPETLSVISVDLRLPNDWGTRRPSLLDALARAGVNLEPVPCGGASGYIEQAREQWTDGANSFAVSPGVILLYSRNARTADELARRGYDVVATSAMSFDGAGRCLHDFLPGRKYVVLLGGEELSRARGGPRCMTMPLVREPVQRSLAPGAL